MKKGTVLQVEKVLAPNPFYSFIKEILTDPDVKYVVKEVGSNQLHDAIIRIDMVGKPDDSTFGLDGTVYEVVHLQVGRTDLCFTR